MAGLIYIMQIIIPEWISNLYKNYITTWLLQIIDTFFEYFSRFVLQKVNFVEDLMTIY